MPNPDRKLLAALKAAEKFTQAMQEVVRILPEELPEGAEFYVGNREAFSFVVSDGVLHRQYWDGLLLPWTGESRDDDDIARSVKKLEAAARLAAALIPDLTPPKK
jgi:FAD/FMN-containing dehydrogenase